MSIKYPHRYDDGGPECAACGAFGPVDDGSDCAGLLCAINAELRTALAAANERADKAEAELVAATNLLSKFWSDATEVAHENIKKNDRLRSHAARWKALAKRYRKWSSLPPGSALTERDQLRAEVEQNNIAYDVLNETNAELMVEVAAGLRARHDLNKQLNAALAEVEQLRTALRKYGGHDPACPAGFSYQARLAEDDDGSRASYPCTCGLDAALGEEGEGA